MTNLTITTEELNKLGFDCDTEVGSILYTNREEILDYFSADQDAIEEIERMGDVVLELIVDIQEGIATAFQYGFGRSPETVTACNEDDLNGVIEWLRR